jgi:hypothetical protein
MIGGFGVMFKEVIYDLFCLSQNTERYSFTVDWTNPSIPYYDKEKGNNVWDYYFTDNTNKENEIIDYYNTIKPKLDSEHLSKVFINMNHDTPIDKDKIKKLNEIYCKNIVIKEEIIENANNFFKENLIGKTLGVQYRYTDKIKEVEQITPQKFINLIKNIIGEYDTIYLATDYQPVVDELSEYSKKIKYYDAQRSSTNIGSHFLSTNRQYDNYLKGYECLVDVLLLSKCNDYYYSKSNISLLPLIINNMSYNYIKLINKI